MAVKAPAYRWRKSGHAGAAPENYAVTGSHADCAWITHLRVADTVNGTAGRARSASQAALQVRTA